MLTSASRKSMFAVGLGCWLLLGLGQAGAQQIGTAGAVNPATNGTPPNAPTRTIALGLGIVDRERIVTSASGSAQIIFTDTSTMNIGRDSQVVIDRYVYDPASNTGTQAVSLGKGVLRFVGGQVSHSEGMSVTTPVATIGVRGGTSTMGFAANCGVAVINQSGVVGVTNRAGSVNIRRPDYYVCVASADTPIGEPKPVPPELLARFAALLTSTKGQTGGSRKRPTDPDLLAAGIGIGNVPWNPGPPNGTPGLSLVGIPLAGDTIVRGATPGDHVAPRPPPPVTPPPPDNSIGNSIFDITNANSINLTVGN